MPVLAAALLLLTQDPTRATSTPPGGDTVGYWQQRIAYTIVATLDEPAQRIRARATLHYVNNSPDTLREMYVHQYLNAFRPHSTWSAVDEREGRERFQRLVDPHYGYERFTAPVRVNGEAVAVTYPGAPDSTVVRFALPRALAPRDSLDVTFEWDARPSTVPRRQGRRGRHWDLPQWFPKVAVYDRGGWQPNALQPAGEFYGEFGTYDVTLVLPQDQIVAASGVPVSGDPGWSRALRAGTVRTASEVYREVPPAPRATVPAGYRAVRFFARDVHHFAWSASPDYRYEGGVYVRQRLRPSRVPRFDTVSVHAFWRPGDDTTWGGLRAVRRTVAALEWLEAIYGVYPHPQLTSNHRLDGGGSELPMFLMNGSASQGLILHEGGHMYTYGALANNEWRSGWMDEGATSYQTAWAQRLTPQERVRAGIVDQRRPVTGYRARGITMPLPRFEVVALGQATADLTGEAQPIGTVSHEFRDFNTYNDMIYDRSEVMHSQLRDVLGDSLFVAFMHDYYDRWALRHVDELAMRSSAERVSGHDLRWFFDQWVHRTGVTDYALRRVRHSRDASGGWITDATVRRRAQYRHPMIVGVRTTDGWTFGRMSALPYDEETVRITTSDEPLEVRLDPHHFTWDWDRRNDRRGSRTRYSFDWPFLDQMDRERNVSLLSPIAWYTEPGRWVIGARERQSYLGIADRVETGIGYAVDPRVSLEGSTRIPYWIRFQNPVVRGRPLMGFGLNWASLDGVLFGQMSQDVERRWGQHALRYGAAITGAAILDTALQPEQWSDESTGDLAFRARYQSGRPRRGYAFVDGNALAGIGSSNGYWKTELAVGAVRDREKTRFAARVYAAAADQGVPPQRAIYLSSTDPLTTFYNHWWRGRGALLKRPGIDWLPLGGGALRGFRWELTSRSLIAANVEAARRLATIPVDGDPAIWLNLFGDVGDGDPIGTRYDFGAGLALRGRIYDRNITVRLDAPVCIDGAQLADSASPRECSGRFKGAWVVTFNDIW